MKILRFIGRAIAAPFIAINDGFIALGEDTRATHKRVREQRERDNAWKAKVLREPKEIDSFKGHYAEWDEWTGSRYVRRDNPNPTKYTVAGTICEGHPVYGWRAKQ